MNRAVIAAVLVLGGAALLWYFYAPTPAKPSPAPAIVPAAPPEQLAPSPPPITPPQPAPAPTQEKTVAEPAVAANASTSPPDPIDPPPPPPPVGTIRGTVIGVSAPGEKASVSLLAGELEVPAVLTYEWLQENNGKTVAVRPLFEGKTEFEFADIQEGTYTLLAGIVTGRVEEIPNWRVEGRIVHLRKGDTLTEHFDLTKK